MQLFAVHLTHQTTTKTQSHDNLTIITANNCIRTINTNAAFIYYSSSWNTNQKWEG